MIRWGAFILSVAFVGIAIYLLDGWRIVRAEERSERVFDGLPGYDAEKRRDARRTRLLRAFLAALASVVGAAFSVVAALIAWGVLAP